MASRFQWTAAVPAAARGLATNGWHYSETLVVENTSGLNRSMPPCLAARYGWDSRAYSSSKVIHHLAGGALLAPAFQVVNNFGGGENYYCQQPSILPNPRIGHAGTGRRIPRSNATNVYPETFAPAPCARSQRNTQNPSPASANWQRRTSISASIRSEPRARTN